MSCEIVTLFILIVILILLLYNAYTELAYVGGAVGATISGGYDSGYDGGFKGKPIGIKNILIVDVANMYVGWYMEKYNKQLPYIQQQDLLRSYVEFMKDHYARFVKKNNMKVSGVNYIVKNYKCSTGRQMSAPNIPNKVFEIFHDFVRTRHNAYITVAEDYKTFSVSEWKKPSYHYLRGRDDYLCFEMARYYKKNYINTFIMSDDKYDDYKYFGQVPPFLATYIYGDFSDKKYIDTVQISKLITPKPNSLGQMKDYNLVKITLEFAFGDKKFMKTSDYKVPVPGHVWD